MMSFYSANCNSVVLSIEDVHVQHSYLDFDYNDIIFTVSDIKSFELVTGFELPKWTVEEKHDNPGFLEIMLTEEFLNR